jgi:DNA-binding SARP family transcriptional activator
MKEIESYRQMVRAQARQLEGFVILHHEAAQAAEALQSFDRVLNRIEELVGEAVITRETANDIYGVEP